MMFVYFIFTVVLTILAFKDHLLFLSGASSSFFCNHHAIFMIILYFYHLVFYFYVIPRFLDKPYT